MSAKTHEQAEKLKAAGFEGDENIYTPPADDKPPLKIICMSDIEVEPVQWLWKPYIPLGKITILQGDPGLGKTFIALRIAAIISKGGVFPIVDGDEKQNAEVGGVIFQTAEDGLADTIKARLIDAEADCSKIFVIDESDEGLTFDDERLREAIQKIRPKLVIIDPLQAYIGADKDMHRANEIRPVMHRLNNLAAEFECAIVLIGHLNKATGGKSIYRGLGSIDIAAAARSIIAVSEFQKMPYRRAVVQIKSSLAPTGKSLLYDLDPSLGFLWAGVSELTADEILNPQVEKEAPSRKEAEEFLLELLADGEMYANEVYNEMEGSGFSEKTIKRAKKKANIISYKEKGASGKWIWTLEEVHAKTHDPLDPHDPIINKEGQEGQEDHIKKGDTVIEITDAADDPDLPFDL